MAEFTKPVKTTFFDLPLEKELYESRPTTIQLPPLRVLITDAGQKFVYCLLYKICAGAVFGENREIYIHLINAKGVIDHKSVFLELEECGFHLLKGWVVTSNIEEAYSDVDVVVWMSSFEERSGVSYKDALASHVIRGRIVMRNIATFAKPDVRIILISPSTKFSLGFLQVMHCLEPQIPSRNMSVVTLLDEAIARANLAARLRTTTNKIRNITVWGMTCPDVHNATVLTLPRDDFGATEEVEISVHEALQDDKYLHDQFVECVFKREIGKELSRSGKSLAVATARHLKALYQGSENGEIISMGVLTPATEPYSVPEGFPFSFPVKTPGDGTWIVREDVKFDVRTHLNLLRSIDQLIADRGMLFLGEAVQYILEYEDREKDVIRISEKSELIDKIVIPPWKVKYLVEFLPGEAIPKTMPRLLAKKSIVWDASIGEREDLRRKSSIRFEPQDRIKRPRTGSILKRSSYEDTQSINQL